ncbi:MAG: DNA repair protein RecO [Clostridiaceae bacterium]|jgi:DNA repair protein RecO (recombination protein O)|nr:DNA repair protein RecO [Clostridiaceae bacterium]
MALIKTKGFVLRAVSVGESDRIISLLTEEHGLISVSVRGARRARSPYLMTTQVFCLGSFELFANKNRYRLQASELIEPFSALQQDLERLVCASHLAEVLLDALRDDLPQPVLYRLWAYSLQALCRQPDPLLAVHVAQLRLLMEIGFSPQLDRCQDCGKPVGPGSWRTSISAGSVYCDKPSCGLRSADVRTLPSGGLACLVHIRQSPLGRLFDFRLSDDVRAFIIEFSAAYLTYHLDKVYSRLDMLRHLKAEDPG